MNISDFAPWGVMVAGLLTAIVGFFRWRSQIIFVDPDLLRTISDDLSSEIEKRRALEGRLDVATRRISSLEHNEQMNQRRMREMERKHEADRTAWQAERQALLEGIETLINQIVERHNSRPDWTPE